MLRLALRRAATLLPRRNATGGYGYYIVFPEVPEAEDLDGASLFEASGLPSLAASPEEALEAAAKAAVAFDLSAADLVRSFKEAGKEVDFAGTLGRRETDSAAMEATWGVAKQIVSTTAAGNHVAMDDAAKVERLTSKATLDNYAAPHFYRALKELSGSPDLDLWQRRLVDKWLLEGRLSGMELSGEEMERLKAFQHAYSTHASTFLLNITATLPTYDARISDFKELEEAPEELVVALARSEDPFEGPWSVPLRPEAVWPFLEYGADPFRRASVWRAWNDRAGFQTPYYNNSVNIEEIRTDLEDKAKLLGFDSYCELRHETTMAGSVDSVNDFLHSCGRSSPVDAYHRRLLRLKTRMAPRWGRHYEGMMSFAGRSGERDALHPWDISYYTRKFAQGSHKLETESPLRDFFPFNVVVKNLLSFASELLGIQFTELPSGSFPCNDPSVRAFEVNDSDSGKFIGHFYLDPYKRAGKSVHTWVYLGRPYCPEKNQTPIVFLNTNILDKGAESASQGLHWDQLREILTEFGKGMQYLLCESPYPGVAGLNNMEWDTMDAVGSLFSSFAHHPTSLLRLSDQERAQPLSIQDATTASHCFMEASIYEFYRKIFISEFDQRMYISRRPFWRDVYTEMWAEYFPQMRMWKDDNMPCSFTPIFTGRLPAVYYGKLWSEMLARDMLSEYASAEAQGSGADFGRRLRSQVLRFGGGAPFDSQLTGLIGRQPSLTPLLSFYEVAH